MSELPETISIKEAFEVTLLMFKEQQDEITDIKAKYEIAVSALEKIEDFNTLDGAKYNSYEQGWFGVANFARQTLAELGEK